MNGLVFTVTFDHTAGRCYFRLKIYFRFIYRSFIFDNISEHYSNFMKTLHIYVSDEMNDRLQYFIKSEGFKGPSEFFRFMVKYFEYLPPTPKRTLLDRFRGNVPYQPSYFDFYPQQISPNSTAGIPYSSDPTSDPINLPPQQSNPPTPS